MKCYLLLMLDAFLDEMIDRMKMSNLIPFVQDWTFDKLGPISKDYEKFSFLYLKDKKENKKFLVFGLDGFEINDLNISSEKIERFLETRDFSSYFDDVLEDISFFYQNLAYEKYIEKLNSFKLESYGIFYFMRLELNHIDYSFATDFYYYLIENENGKKRIKASFQLQKIYEESSKEYFFYIEDFMKCQSQEDFIKMIKEIISTDNQLYVKLYNKYF